METKLLPCPWCGGEAEVRVWRNNLGVTVECQRRCTFKHDDTEAEAVEAWNTRHKRTCRMELTELSSASAFHDIWRCLACGEEIERHTVMGKSDPPNYCPECGAKVVE